MLLNKIVSTPRREVAGARTQKRFDFQKHWAICKILDIHSKAEDYIVLLEFHDDVAVLNHSTNPTEIDFFQIKTVEKLNVKPWKVNTLTAKKKTRTGSGSSILGKLYSNKLLFSEAVTTRFVSNANFELDLKGGGSSLSRNRVRFEDLDPLVQAAIKKKLSDELGVSTLSLADFGCLEFEVSVLTPTLQEELTRDQISQFIETNFVGVSYQIGPVYKSFFAEVSRVSNFDKEISDVAALVQKKGMSKSTVNRIFEAITLSSNNSSLEQVRLAIESELRTQGTNFSDILNIRDSWREFEVCFLQRDPLLEKINKKIGQCLQYARVKSVIGSKVIEARDAIVELYLKAPIIQSRFNLEVIRSIALYNLYVA